MKNLWKEPGGIVQNVTMKSICAAIVQWHNWNQSNLYMIHPTD